MILLAVDTTMGMCSVAVTRDGATLAFVQDNEAGHQAERLVPMMESCISQAGLTGYSTLDGLAVTIGPGSFTSVRIGLSAVKGVSIVTSIPLIGLTTLEVYAFTAQKKRATETIAVVLDARRDQCYLQTFCCTGAIPEPLTEATLHDNNELPALLKQASAITGCGLPLLPKNISALLNDVMPDARDIGLLAEIKLASGITLEKPEPLYIRPPDAKLPT